MVKVLNAILDVKNLIMTLISNSKAKDPIEMIYMVVQILVYGL